MKPAYRLHVGDQDFARSSEYIHQIFLKLFDKYPRRLGGVELEILIRETYEHTHGIADHESLNVPDVEHYLGLVLKREGEETYASSRLSERMDAYLENDIATLTNESWTSFKNLPTAELELLLERAEAKNRRKEKAMTDFTNKMRDEDNRARMEDLRQGNSQPKPQAT